MQEISEEELQHYIGETLSEEQYEEYDSRKMVNHEIQKSISSLTNVVEQLENLRVLYSEKEIRYDLAKKSLFEAHRKMRKAMHHLNVVGLYSGAMDRREEVLWKTKELTFTQDNQILHIDFPDLLPRRITKNSVVTYKDMERMYEPAFRKFIENGKFRIYSNKAVIKYTHFFESQKQFVDHDNFETKMVTDLITSCILLDDSPKNCAIFMDYKLGDQCHTEVDVMPYDYFFGYCEGSPR